jgi:hypothetical protein
VTASERHATKRRFGLAELIDFEVQLASDRDRPYRELLERDRQIALRWEDRPETPRDALARWLVSLQRGNETPSAGQRFRRARTLVDWLVFFSFALVGVAVALAVLQFTGGHPINVFVVLGVFVLLQLLNLAVTIGAFLWSHLSSGSPTWLPLMALVRKLILRLAGSRDGLRLLARRRLYTTVERWALFQTAQLGAAAFNVGALATFVVAVALTDLAFAWSTTLRVGAESLQRFCEALALPWRAWLPDAVPTLELIHATQYFRLEAAYVNAPAGMRAEDAAASGGWWPFLLMCLLVYGLLPRLVLVAWGSLGMRLALHRLPFDTPEEAEVMARLTTPRVRSVHEADPGNMTPLGEGLPPLASPMPLGPDERVTVVRWREADLPEEAFPERFRRRFGAIVQRPIAEAGGHDHADDQATLARVEAGSNPVVVVAEPWNAPDRAFKRFVRLLRQSGAPNRKIYVLLTGGGDAEQRAVWAGYLAELKDPYIALGDL